MEMINNRNKMLLENRARPKITVPETFSGDAYFVDVIFILKRMEQSDPG